MDFKPQSSHQTDHQAKELYGFLLTKDIDAEILSFRIEIRKKFYISWSKKFTFLTSYPRRLTKFLIILRKANFEHKNEVGIKLSLTFFIKGL